MKRLIFIIATLILPPSLALASFPELKKSAGVAQNIDGTQHYFFVLTTINLREASTPSGKTRYVLYLEMETNVNFIRGVFTSKVQSNIPKGNCRNRYRDHNEYSVTAQPNGTLKGQSNFTYEKWACERVPYPCHDSWLDFDTCYKDLKTRSLRSTFHPQMVLTPSMHVDGDTGQYSLRISVNAFVESRLQGLNIPNISIPPFPLPGVSIPIELDKPSAKYVNSANNSINLVANVNSFKLKKSAAEEIYEYLVDQGFLSTNEWIREEVRAQKKAGDMRQRIAK